MPKRTGRAKAAGQGETLTPQWFVFVIITTISFMLCLAINLRAYSEMSREIEQNQILSSEIERLTIENQAIQQEIENLRSDERAIEREARKIGMSRPNEKILVPVN
jgi:cell division protein FtsB